MPGHLHVHVLPRWAGDTNFMTSIAGSAGAPRELARRLRQAETATGPGSFSRDRRRDERAGDELPDDLDVTAYVGPYVFPDIKRRRIAGALYTVLGLFLLWGAIASGNGGLLFGAILLLAIAAYHFAAGWPLRSTRPKRSRSRAARSASRSGTRRRSSRGAAG